MVKARRAKRSPARAVVAVLIAAAVVLGLVAVQQGWFTGDRSATASPSLPASPGSSTGPTGSGPSSSAASPSATASSSTTSASPTKQSPSASGTASASDPTGTAASAALEECRASVQAADDVLEAARVGIGHWSEHVQAQTDANKGKISLAKMAAIFKRTRLDGPNDVRAYDEARDKAKDRSGSCEPPDGSPAAVEDTMGDCRKRSEAQQPVLAAAADGMGDWKSHLAAMRRSRMGHVHDAQGVWIRAWRAAPPHIKAFDRADDRFDAPTC
jgi:hypothetical protein